MREKISILGQGNSFAYVDFELTNEELSLLDRLQFDKIPIGAATPYERFGNLHLLEDGLPVFLSNIGNNDEEVIQVITKIISKTVYNI
ncbi:hypothetical protein [Candidatus Protochlamydia sp. R18]|uniref:hypothetical protein n=1 Tax=Candidatus Protochlamydia sp. R18 TaxID=1353977 RepID=UPI0005A7F9C6|nr:hypothetical protein [Candidatus Protochlamydia sp. R18]